MFQCVKCRANCTVSNKGLIQHIEKEGVMLSSGDFVPCDVVVGCIGFERSNFLCKSLTGRCEVKTTNYLDQHMMYLADAEIDEGESDEMRQRAQIETGMGFLRSLVSPCFNYCNGTTFLLVWRGLSSLFPHLPGEGC